MNIGLEIKKNHDIRIIALIVMLVFMNGVSLCRYINTYAYEEKQYQEAKDYLYSQLSGKLTQGKYGYILEMKASKDELVDSGNYSTEYDESTLTGYVRSDYNLYTEIYDYMCYCRSYADYSDGLKAKIEQNISFYREKGNQHMCDIYEELLKSYGDREITEIYDMTALKSLLSYSTSELFALVALLLLCSGIFSMERQRKSNMYVLTTRRGKAWNTSVKLVTVVLLSVAVELVFILEKYLIFAVMTDLSGISCPLYCMVEYKDTAFAGTILEFVILNEAMRLAGFAVLGLLIAFASSLTGRKVFSTILSIALMGALIYMTGATGLLTVFDAFSLNETMQSLWYVKISGRPFSGMDALGMVLFGSAVLCVVGVFICECGWKKIWGKERI